MTSERVRKRCVAADGAERDLVLGCVIAYRVTPQPSPTPSLCLSSSCSRVLLRPVPPVASLGGHFAEELVVRQRLQFLLQEGTCGFRGRWGLDPLTVCLCLSAVRYICVAIADVEANYTAVRAYDYTTVTSVQVRGVDQHSIAPSAFSLTHPLSC